MQISIKRIGYKVGTVGWLAAGLQSGAITITEGTMQGNGNHGLWLKCASLKLSQFLAAFDEYGVGDELPSAATYAPADDLPGNRKPIFTDAAWDVLQQIAADWCEMCNAERETDTPVSIKAVRVA